MTERAPSESELAAVERALDRMAPERRPTWAALLNALVVEAEVPTEAHSVRDAIRQTLLVLAQEAGGFAGRAAIERLLDTLVRAVVLPPEILPGSEAASDRVPPYSFGANLAVMVATLRFDLGLSVLYVFRHLRPQLGRGFPPLELRRCIAQVRRPPTAAGRSR